MFKLMLNKIQHHRQDLGWGSPGHAKVAHTFEAVAGSWVSGSAVNAPAVSRVMGGAPERNKNSKKKIGEITFGEGFVNVVSLTYIGHI